MYAPIEPSKHKQSNAELANRNDHIITLLAQGKKRAQILVDPLVLSWRMSNASIDKYLQKAKGDIVENSQQARSEHLGRAVMNLDFLYSVALESMMNDDGKLKTDKIPTVRVCLDIQKEKNRLLQLSKVYDPSSTDMSDEVLPDEVHRLIDEVKIVNAPVRAIDLEAEVGKSLLAGSSN